MAIFLHFTLKVLRKTIFSYHVLPSATASHKSDLMQKTKYDLRDRLPKLYSQDLLNNLFRYPYTKIEFIERELGVSRPTATKYLEQLTSAGLVRKQKMGRSNFYINEPLYALLSGVTLEQVGNNA